jgi:hypothetical protein
MSSKHPQGLLNRHAVRPVTPGGEVSASSARSYWGGSRRLASAEASTENPTSVVPGALPRPKG